MSSGLLLVASQPGCVWLERLFTVATQHKLGPGSTHQRATVKPYRPVRVARC